MKRLTTKRIVLCALFAALVYVSTVILRIPSPITGGHKNLGDFAVFLAAFLIGPKFGAAAAAVGSGLADLLNGYPQFVPGTFLIKGLMALSAGMLHRRFGRFQGGVRACVCSLLPGVFWLPVGYFIYESLFLGFGATAAVSIPGNVVQGVVGAVLATAVYRALYRIEYVRERLSIF